MKKIIISMLVCFLLIVGNIFAQDDSEVKYTVNPTKDENFTSGIYIPKNLEDCFKELEKILHADLIEEMKSGSEDEMVLHHLGLGIWIRNNWELWSGSRLSTYFNGMGINHPDDMSGIILDSFWRHLNSKPIQLEKQTQHYIDYWNNIKTENP